MIENEVSIPESYQCPELQQDGKWFPVGFPTYFCYVCWFTRVNDLYVHLYASDGRDIDCSMAMNRKDERKKKLAQKNKERDEGLNQGKKRGVDVETNIIIMELNEGFSKKTIIDYLYFNSGIYI